MKVWTAAISFFLLTACVNAGTKNKINDVCEILQLTVNLPKLQQYYHVDKKAERKPLILVVPSAGLSCKSLGKFGSSVIVSESINQQIPYLQILKINLKPNNIEVEFEYKEEGIKGSAVFKKHKNSWNVISEKIIEM